MTTPRKPPGGFPRDRRSIGTYTTNRQDRRNRHDLKMSRGRTTRQQDQTDRRPTGRLDKRNRNS